RDLTNATKVVFKVTFSEVVKGVGVNDFTVDTDTAVTGASVFKVSAGPAKVYMATVITGTGDGRLGLNMVDHQNIYDTADHQLHFGTFPKSEYMIDKTAPTVNIIGPTLSDGSTFANAGAGDTVKYIVSFSDDNLAPPALTVKNIFLTPGTVRG